MATAIKDLALSSSAKCLCHQSRRKRLALVDALQTLEALTAEIGTGIATEMHAAGKGRDAPLAGGGDLAEASSSASSLHTGAKAADAGGTDAPALTPLSRQVRALRKGTDASEGVKSNMLVAFGVMMERLDGIYVERAAEAPKSFEE